MRERDRLWATVVIWVAYMAIMGVLVVFGGSRASSLSADVVFAVALVCSLAAGLSTYGVWDKARGGVVLPPETDRQARKTKRVDRGRIGRLLEDLDEDEIVELETLLAAREQDAPER